MVLAWSGCGWSSMAWINGPLGASQASLNDIVTASVLVTPAAGTGTPTGTVAFSASDVKRHQSHRRRLSAGFSASCRGWANVPGA
jgi:hypothetical protein